MFYIYRIINTVNDKSYIGFTENPNRRWAQHQRGNSKECYKLQRAFKKYGYSNFSFEILYENENKTHTLSEMEPHYIALYDSIKNGYNVVRGGGGSSEEVNRMNSERMKFNNPMFRPEVREKVSKILTGRVMPPKTVEAKERLRQSKLGSNNPNFGNAQASIHMLKTVVCESCGKNITIGNYKRWHGEKCNPKRGTPEYRNAYAKKRYHEKKDL